MKKRGRPKGAEKTVIGLPKKHKVWNKPVSFLKQPPRKRERGNFFLHECIYTCTYIIALTCSLLYSDSLLVCGVQVASRALNGDVIEEDQVEVRPEKVCASCLDENVCLKICRKYFTHDAWLAVEDVVGRLKDNPLWYCGRCGKPIDDDTESSIIIM